MTLLKRSGTARAPFSRVLELLPGLAMTTAGVGVSVLVNRLVPPLSALTVAVVIAALLANARMLPSSTRAGTQFAAKRLLRVGVALLGLQLSALEVARLSGSGLAVVLIVVIVTFFGTQWLGRCLGVSPGLSLLVATGFSICGAAAIAAMEGVGEADEEEVAYAITLVTVYGCLAIVLLPLLRAPLGLGEVAFGTWAGASVHEVAQVVATASAVGSGAMASAVVVKLTRVVFLAPMVAGVGLARRRRDGVTAGNARPPILPLFVVAFLAMIAVRSVGVVPTAWLAWLKTIDSLLLAAALFGLGTNVDVAKLRSTGLRPLALGLLASIFVAAVAYACVRLLP
jgi:uncharacterized integral membrane protein (TIGR00698 family)